MKKERKKVYVFVTNVIELKDVRLKGIHPLTGRLLPLRAWEFIFRNIFGHKTLSSLGYKKVAEYDILDQAKGYTVLVKLSAEQMWKYKKHAQSRVLAACRYAQDKLGADVISLGSLAKSITAEGAWLKNQGIKTPITHGDTYTVASSFEGIKRLLALHNLGDNATIGILGAYGKIGLALGKLLYSNGFKVILMGRSQKKLDDLQSEYGANNARAKITPDLKTAVNESDIIVGATSAPYSIISEDCLSPEKNYIIYDVGQPNNLDRDDYCRLVSKGYKIHRYDGAFVELSAGIDIGFWMRLKPYISYACFVEGILQTLAGNKENHLGQVDLAHVIKTSEWAENYGFRHADLTNFLEPVNV